MCVPQFQPPPQKSNLESMIERFIQTQSKTDEALGESMGQLNAKFESLSTHQMMMETQLAQIAQKVSHLSRPPRHLPDQLEANPKGHMNTITLRSGKQLECSVP